MADYTREDYERAAREMRGIARLMAFNRDGFHSDAHDRRALWHSRVVVCEGVAAMLTEAAEMADEKARCPRCGHYWSNHTITTRGTLSPCPTPAPHDGPAAQPLAPSDGASEDGL